MLRYISLSHAFVDFMVVESGGFALSFTIFLDRVWYLEDVTVFRGKQAAYLGGMNRDQNRL
jgi:hypothetical protein